MKPAEVVILMLVVLPIGVAAPSGARAGERSVAAACTTLVATHTNAGFSGVSVTAQGGFQQSEIAAASYPLAAGSFPLRLDTLEIVFLATGTTVTTTTSWTALVYRGLPSTGTLLATFSSNGGSIPHLVLPPGTTGGLVRQVIDPSSPIIITDDGSHSFSIGFRVDGHNSPPPDPCTGTPASSSNAFPTTDVNGLNHSADNWVRGVDCGPSGCPAGGGWARFSQLPAYCRPSGDWVMRAAYRPAYAAAETSQATCRDGIDNDCDGAVDCADSDCAADSTCTTAAVDPFSTGRDPGPRLSVANPFVPGLGRIGFTLPVAARVRVDLLDVAGQLVARLAEDEYAAGYHALQWGGRSRYGGEVSPGMLFVRLTDARGHASVRPMVLIR